MEKAKVYFTKNITSEGLVKIYEALHHDLKGKVAVKISTGEPGGHNFLDPNLIKDLIHKLDGTIVECNTAYKGKRLDTKDHYQAIKDHGFMDIAPCQILDEESEIDLPTSGKHLKGKNIVGAHIKEYDSMLMLSHFKGHPMGGFGGALKNMSIGLASTGGKAWIHSSGNTTDIEEMWSFFDRHTEFLESMAEADKAIVDFLGKENLVYINVANNLSVDCDCNANPKDPEMEDIGIFASLDPVALDQCCYDQIMNSEDPGKESLVNRMIEKNAIHVVEEAERLGIGTRDYEIIDIDQK